MALSWNEIKDRALKFSNEWQDASRENAEKQTFYNEFFNVFGISRRRVASFEEPIKKLGNKQGFIDLFWKGLLIVEHKSKGQNLEKAYSQAHDYFPNLKEEEFPRFVLVSDFQRFRLYDLETEEDNQFTLDELHKNVYLFDFIAGYKRKDYKDVEPASIKASELMGKLYDSLKESGYPEHDLELFLVRLLFCLFADDTGIFEKDIFTFFIEEKTREDGLDVGEKIAHLFQTLNMPYEKRGKHLDEDLARFAYINGALFERSVNIPAFNSKMREALLKCCRFNWSLVSPAIFGSLFQCVYDKEKRREKGEHYTSEKNIMKLIEPLFLDNLKQEFEQVKHNKNKLQEFHNKLASLKFLDPACGCGNFLVISYRELRRLEIKVLKKLLLTGKQQAFDLDVKLFSKIDVDNFYGIEIEEFPAKIAEVALWMTDHLMNIELSEAFGQYFARIPLRKSAKIVNDNALRIDWNEVISRNELSYILGNPPFKGKQYRIKQQNEDMEIIFSTVKGYGVLDYVSSWYIKASEYIKNTKIKVAFVSTNSIAQGEQVGILWNELFKKYKIKILFAHRTFNWSNEAKGKAQVHCVIIGFANFDINNKKLYDYEDIKGEPHEIIVKNINPYLAESKDIVVLSKNKPICNVPEIIFGSMPNDGGHLLLNDQEKEDLIKAELNAKKYIRPLVGSIEFINKINRWCLWLVDASPIELSSMPEILKRINLVKKHRLSSKREATKKLSNRPLVFGEIRQPQIDYLAIPSISSERRKYIPIGFLPAQVIVTNKILIIPNANFYHFGILTSIMHMTWVNYVSGRLKSDYQYSNKIVYNNFPFPQNPSKTQLQKVEEKAKAVLETREKYPDCSLAVLYNPETMPSSLLKAHTELDKAVDACYGKKSFKNVRERIEFLFDLYDKYTQPLTASIKDKKK